MVRTLGIGLVIIATVVSGYRGLSIWLAAARLDTTVEEPAPIGSPRLAGDPREGLDVPISPTGSGTPITIRNDMPATVTIVAQPGSRNIRIPWGGGDVSLGDVPVQAFTLVYHDPIWPYVYRLTCPDRAQPCIIRMSDLWKGQVPREFGLCRGRLDEWNGSVVWMDEPSPGANS